MKTTKKLLLISLLTSFQVKASTFLVHTGSLSSTGGGIVGAGAWDSDVEVTWDVQFDPSTQLWMYNYRIDVGEKDISHAIIEALEACLGDGGLDSNDFEIQHTSGDTETGFYGPSSHGNSNPGIPATIGGVKFENSSSTTMDLGIITPTSPVWGDVYAKSGKHKGEWTYMYNQGFGGSHPVFDPQGETPSGVIPVPGCGADLIPTPIPEPGSFLMLLGSLGMLHLVRRR